MSEKTSTQLKLSASSLDDHVDSATVAADGTAVASSSAAASHFESGEPCKGSSLKANGRHRAQREAVRDWIIGFTDGLTVPFSLTAGLSALGSTRVVVFGALAEMFAGVISMGLGAYLAVATESKHYGIKSAEQLRRVQDAPAAEKFAVLELLAAYGLSQDVAAHVADGLRANPDMWVKFMMDFHVRLDQPSASRAWVSPLAMGFSYFFGALIPTIPYFAIGNVRDALAVSTAVTAATLLLFGFAKARLSCTSVRAALLSALHTLVVGAVAAATSYGIVMGVEGMVPEGDWC